MLQGWLDRHRQTLLTKSAGLTADQLRKPTAAPSNLTLLGLVRHMTAVERSWFTKRAADAPETVLPYVTEDNRDADFTDVADADGTTGA